MQKLFDVMQNIEKKLTTAVRYLFSKHPITEKQVCIWIREKNNVKQIPEQVSVNTANTSQYQ